MTPSDYLLTALRALRASPLRSLLTTLGIVIGVASLIAMMAIGAGASARIDSVISRFGTNTLNVMPGNGKSFGARLAAGSLPTLNERDAKAIANEIDGVLRVAPQINTSGQLVAGSLNWSSSIQGVTDAYFEVNNWQVAEGRLLEPSDVRSATKVALIGQTVVKNLFPDSDPVGQHLRINRTLFTVIGVLASKGQGGGWRDDDDIVMVPLSAARRSLLGAELVGDWVTGIGVQVDSADRMDTVTEGITTLLRQRHRLAATADNDFNVRNFAQAISSRTDAMRVMTLLLSAVAAISLVVGGIGIMNIMLVTVTERTKEIGLRLAIGAPPNAILIQFVIEAALLSLAGGIIGVTLGLGATAVIAHFSDLPSVVQPGSILLATTSSVATGLFFGYYPARRASALNPIDALRSE